MLSLLQNSCASLSCQEIWEEDAKAQRGCTKITQQPSKQDGSQMPSAHPMACLPVQDPPGSSISSSPTPLPPCIWKGPISPPHLPPLQGKHSPSPPVSNHPPSPPHLPGCHANTVEALLTARGAQRHAGHMARGSGAQRGQRGPKGHTANLQSSAWGAHTLPPRHSHWEKHSSRRRCSKGAAARAQVP